MCCSGSRIETWIFLATLHRCFATVGMYIYIYIFFFLFQQKKYPLLFISSRIIFVFQSLLRRLRSPTSPSLPIIGACFLSPRTGAVDRGADFWCGCPSICKWRPAIGRWPAVACTSTSTDVHWTPPCKFGHRRRVYRLLFANIDLRLLKAIRLVSCGGQDKYALYIDDLFMPCMDELRTYTNPKAGATYKHYKQRQTLLGVPHKVTHSTPLPKRVEISHPQPTAGP